MVLKLYGSPWSTCTRRVTTILYEKQLPYELIPIDFFKGEHKSEEYLQKQPFGLVPYIVRFSAYDSFDNVLTPCLFPPRMMTAS